MLDFSGSICYNINIGSLSENSFPHEAETACRPIGLHSSTQEQSVFHTE